MPAEYLGEMRVEAAKGQEPGAETQVRDVSPASSGAIPTGTADSVTAVFGPSDPRHNELRDIFRRARNATKMRTSEDRRKKQKPIEGTEDPLPPVTGVPSSWRGRTQEDSPPNGMVGFIDNRPPLPHWTSILKGFAGARESREGTIVKLSSQTPEVAYDAATVISFETIAQHTQINRCCSTSEGETEESHIF